MNPSEYIKVDSIADIDPNKLSLSYVGKKFIDKNNNRFSIRFNRETRKMEIVRLATLQEGKSKENSPPPSKERNPKPGSTPALPNSQTPSQKETSEFQTLSQTEPKTQIPTDHSESPKPSVVEPSPIATEKGKPTPKEWDFSKYDIDISQAESSKASDAQPTDSGEKPNPRLEDKWKDKNERDKIADILKRIEEAKKRIQAVLINIKSSRIFEITGDPSENQNIIGNLTREFDVEVFQHLDAASNYLKELTSYPRPVSYYTAKFERTKREELEKADDKQKLHLVIRWEMQEAYTRILASLKALSLSLLKVMNLKNENHLRQLQYMNQLMFKDAKNATLYCLQDIDQLIQEVEDWKYDTAGAGNATK